MSKRDSGAELDAIVDAVAGLRGGSTVDAVSRSVRAPMQMRSPVGYRREFLDDYRPGVTWYLPAAVRRRLFTLGDSPDRERPAGTLPARYMSAC